MNEKLRNHWNNLLQPLFPEDSEFSPCIYSDRYEATISWKITTDPQRPNKRSKTIRIVVPEETIDDYENKSVVASKSDDEKLKRFILDSFKMFEPDHDTSKEMPRPEVKWIAGSGILNS